MLNPLIAHFVQIPLCPTSAQAQALLRLNAAHRSAALIAMDQASMAIMGQDVALSALAGGQDHPDRSPAVEAMALAATPLFGGCPPVILEDAIASYQSLLRQCAVRICDDLPTLSTSGAIACPVRPAEPGSLFIDGVGQVLVDVTHMPEWAYEALWDEPAPADQLEIAYSGSAYVEHQWANGRWNWTVELDFAEIW